MHLDVTFKAINMNSKDVPSSFPKQKKIKSSLWTSIENNYWLTRMIIRRCIQDMLTYLTNKLSNTKSSFDYYQTILNDLGKILKKNREI